MRSFAPSLCALMLVAFAAAADGPKKSLPLFGPDGIRIDDVRQGTLGSCFFHSVVGALAQSEPARLHDMIHPADEGRFRVTFADAYEERVYPDDLDFMRESGYER